MSRIASCLMACMAAWAVLTGAASAQPTPEQQSAIRSNCRSDFMSKCPGVARGGKDALNCLQKNVASLSPACNAAVSVTIPAPPPPPPVEAKPAQPAPAPIPPPPPPAAAMPPPTVPPAAAPEPRGVKPVTPPRAVPARPAPKPPQAQKPAAPPPPPAAAPPLPPQPPPGADAPPPPPAARTPNAPVVMTAVIGRACLRDLLLHCAHIKVGDGRKIACLLARGDRLAPLCKAALKITEPVR